MGVIRGTTPFFYLFLEDVDLTNAQKIYVTIGQSLVRVTLEPDRLIVTADATGTYIAFSLTQEETLKFRDGDAVVQAKFIDADGHVGGTTIEKIDIYRALLERVIEYAPDD